VTLNSIDCHHEDDQYMVETLFPAAPQKRWDFMQDLANHGCYVKQSEKGFAINKGWKYVDINKQLHLWFPQVFKHLDSQCWGIPTVSDAKPDWQLLCCDGRCHTPNRFGTVNMEDNINIK